MERINLIWTNDRDVHYSTDKSNPTLVESLDQGKARPYFFKSTQRFGAKIGPPGMPHKMSGCSGPTLV